ncbi:MAG: hypothetical protein IJ083_07525 [Clostridia bacterium]|nr:hypothetical protein [Clostridia bacterium]
MDSTWSSMVLSRLLTPWTLMVFVGALLAYTSDRWAELLLTRMKKGKKETVSNCLKAIAIALAVIGCVCLMMFT